jgi:hypothetical protein
MSARSGRYVTAFNVVVLVRGQYVLGVLGSTENVQAVPRAVGDPNRVPVPGGKPHVAVERAANDRGDEGRRTPAFGPGASYPEDLAFMDPYSAPLVPTARGAERLLIPDTGSNAT